jgi:uncharacterized protein
MMTTQIDSTQSTRAIVRKLYEDASEQNFEGFLAALSPDVVVKEPGFLPYGGTYRGLAEFQALFEKVGALLDVTGLTVEQIVADGDHAIGIITVPCTNGGAPVRLAETSTLRDGVITEMEIFFHELGGLAR